MFDQISSSVLKATGGQILDFLGVENVKFVPDPPPLSPFNLIVVNLILLLKKSCSGLTMKSLGVHPSQPEMQNLVGVEISTLKSDWGALQAHEKGW